MCCRSISQHQTMWPNMRHCSMGSMWLRTWASAEKHVLVIQIWWCSNLLEIWMLSMPTWPIDFMSRKSQDFFKAASTSTYLGWRMKLLISFRSLGCLGRQSHPGYPSISSELLQSSPHLIPNEFLSKSKNLRLFP